MCVSGKKELPYGRSGARLVASERRLHDRYFESRQGRRAGRPRLQCSD